MTNKEEEKTWQLLSPLCWKSFSFF
jgi:hypothetical protein